MRTVLARAPDIDIIVLDLTVMHAMSFAFPLLKNDRDWTATVSAALVELKPTKRQHEDILIEASRISGRLKRELTPMFWHVLIPRQSSSLMRLKAQACTILPGLVCLIF
jgi:hypothetical protein